MEGSMKLTHLKNTVGFCLVGLHIVAIGLCFLLLRNKLSSNDFRITILILSPVSAVYAMAFLRDTVRNMFVVENDGAQNKVEQRRVTVTMASLSIIFSVFFS